MTNKKDLPYTQPSDAKAESIPPAMARSRLTINLRALRQNYANLRQKSQGAECAAVIKSDGYGLGITQVAKALFQEGCRTFFVASLSEAVRLRNANVNCVIYVFDGVFAGNANAFEQYQLRPVLNSIEQIKEWMEYWTDRSSIRCPAAIHVDTGMNRLGLAINEMSALIQNGLLEKLPISLVMSHLACADNPNHEMNETQLRQFHRITEHFQGVHASLSNSAGIFLGTDYHYDIVRPGIALYGGKPQNTRDNPMMPVVTLEGRIIQIRDCQPGETVGYGASQSIEIPCRIATVATGYGDGYFRLLGSSDAQQGAYVAINGRHAPLIGRVSMDLISIDLSGFSENEVKAGDFVELFGPHISIQEVAEWSGTIDYEILTNLGSRYTRVYME